MRGRAQGFGTATEGSTRASFEILSQRLSASWQLAARISAGGPATQMMDSSTKHAA